MLSTEFLRALTDERERQVAERLRVRSLIRLHRAPQRRAGAGSPEPRGRR